MSVNTYHQLDDLRVDLFRELIVVDNLRSDSNARAIRLENNAAKLMAQLLDAYRADMEYVRECYARVERGEELYQ